jgi:hypothetical protein
MVQLQFDPLVAQLVVVDVPPSPMSAPARTCPSSAHVTVLPFIVRQLVGRTMVSEAISVRLDVYVLSELNVDVPVALNEVS